MGTQLEEARRGKSTRVMKAVAEAEHAPLKKVMNEVAAGRAVIPHNPAHDKKKPAIVGTSFRTKVNANLGRSPSMSGRKGELRKLEVALAAGADFVMDLSVGANVDVLRNDMLKACPVPLGTVPVYEAVCRTKGSVLDPDESVLINVIREQAEQGVDFMTLHAGILRDHVDLALKRVMGIVSRGGALMADWMMSNKRENPLWTRWDEIMDICASHDVTVSLGDGLRPGCLADASDAAQFAELETIGILVERCRERGVQVMVEGPGHVPLDEIGMNVEREKKVCGDAPFYVLGPVVTDIAPGYDHIASAIGAAVAGYHGAALLCYVTPSEHLGLPTDEDVHEGVIAYRIAAHAADVARGLPGARQWDDAMARARMAFDWKKQFELAVDGDRARRRHREAGGKTDAGYCSMCGEKFCAVRATGKLRRAFASETRRKRR